MVGNEIYLDWISEKNVYTECKHITGENINEIPNQL